MNPRGAHSPGGAESGGGLEGALEEEDGGHRGGG